jgi:hypothetical protein
LYPKRTTDFEFAKPKPGLLLAERLAFENDGLEFFEDFRNAPKASEAQTTCGEAVSATKSSTMSQTTVSADSPERASLSDNASNDSEDECASQEHSVARVAYPNTGNTTDEGDDEETDGVPNRRKRVLDRYGVELAVVNQALAEAIKNNGDGDGDSVDGET